MVECRSNAGLHYWADIYRRRSPDAGFLSTARDFGLVDGYAAGMQNLSGSRRGLISLSGGGLSNNYRDGLVLEIVIPHLYQAMDRIVYRRKFMEMPAVTRREKEVLKWVTCGKTNWETSVILCVSECTIRFHMNNVMKKLNATSKTHAVAIALAAGLVELD
jgi:DNA-binding CsgD family transcriptional regulator